MARILILERRSADCADHDECVLAWDEHRVVGHSKVEHVQFGVPFRQSVHFVELHCGRSEVRHWACSTAGWVWVEVDLQHQHEPKHAIIIAWQIFPVVCVVQGVHVCGTYRVGHHDFLVSSEPVDDQLLRVHVWGALMKHNVVFFSVNTTVFLIYLRPLIEGNGSDQVVELSHRTKTPPSIRLAGFPDHCLIHALDCVPATGSQHSSSGSLHYASEHLQSRRVDSVEFAVAEEDSNGQLVVDQGELRVSDPAVE